MTRPLSYRIVDSIRDARLWLMEKWEYFKHPGQAEPIADLMDEGPDR